MGCIPWLMIIMIMILMMGMITIVPPKASQWEALELFSQPRGLSFRVSLRTQRRMKGQCIKIHKYRIACALSFTAALAFDTTL